MEDVLWALLSCFIVWLYVAIHTRSVFVSSCAMAQIALSFPITLVLYRNIFAISNVSALHLMIVFVVLGIAADNIFVIWDAWTQSATF